MPPSSQTGRSGDGGTSGPGFSNTSTPVLHRRSGTRRLKPGPRWPAPPGPGCIIPPPFCYLTAAPLRPADRARSPGSSTRRPTFSMGTRPTISSAPDAIAHGQQFFVATPNATSITKVHLIKLSSVTHGFNQDQRINRLVFSQGTGGLNVTAPANGNVSPPGYYLLFIVNSTGCAFSREDRTSRSCRTGAGGASRTCCDALERSGVAGLVECQRRQCVTKCTARRHPARTTSRRRWPLCPLRATRLGSDEWHDSTTTRSARRTERTVPVRMRRVPHRTAVS